MGKTAAKRRHDEAEEAFRRAWKLLDRIERRLERARAEEVKRLRQLGDGSGRKAAKRAAQLEAARSEITQIEGLMTELSELIAANARASSGQTVKDLATSVAAEIKDEAAEPPDVLPRRRNRQHRRRRRPAEATVGVVETATEATPDESEPALADEEVASADVEAEPIEAAPAPARRRNRQHRPRRRTPAAPEIGSSEVAPTAVAASIEPTAPAAMSEPEQEPEPVAEPEPVRAAEPEPIAEPEVVTEIAPGTVETTPVPAPSAETSPIAADEEAGTHFEAEALPEPEPAASDLEPSPFAPGPPPAPTIVMGAPIVRESSNGDAVAQPTTGPSAEPARPEGASPAEPARPSGD